MKITMFPLLLCWMVLPVCWTSSIFAQTLPIKPITDNGGLGTGTVTWSSDTVYLLQGKVFVNPGDTLTIEAGTVIKGQSTFDADSIGVLVVSAGAHIRAVGTETEPIIFTTELDDIDDPFDVPNDVSAGGLWGGVYILGRACNNNVTAATLDEDLAILPGLGLDFPTQDSLRALYGAVDGPCDDSYNAGTMAYVSIRYTGAETPDYGSEYNGLALVGVGTGTDIHHIEVVYTRDDAFEFVGSKLCAKYLMAGGIGDDCYDFDQGSQVTLQFITAVTGGSHGGSRILEIDGSLVNGDQQPYGRAEIYNATFISLDQSGTRLCDIRDNAQAVVRNSVFYGFQQGVRVEVDDADTTDSYQQFLAGEVEVDCNIFWQVAQNDSSNLLIPYDKGGDPVADSSAFTSLRAYFDASSNQIADPLFTNLSSTDSLDLSPLPGSPLLSAACPLPSNPCLTQTLYTGAFEPDSSSVALRTMGWAQGWTHMSDYYYSNNAQTTSLTSPREVSKLSIYPNPTSGTIQVIGDVNIDVLVLSDMQGRRIRQWQPRSQKATVSLEGLSSGIYVLQAQDEQGRISTQRIDLR